MAKKTALFQHNFRVRYAETDRMGVSYYANYFVWFEMGRAEYLRFLNISYTDYEKNGIFLPAVEASCRYIESTTYDDFLTIQVAVSHFGKTSVKFVYRILKNGKRAAEGHTVHAFVNRDNRPIRIPAEILQKVPIQEIKD